MKIMFCFFSLLSCSNNLKEMNYINKVGDLKDCEKGKKRMLIVIENKNNASKEKLLEALENHINPNQCKFDTHTKEYIDHIIKGLVEMKFQKNSK